jgi:YhcH/YjgK/YiaL family protein
VILLSLRDAGRQALLSPRIQAGLDWLREWDPSREDGHHQVRGDEVFALVASYHTGPATEKRFETHRRYLDLQYLASGRERILYAPAAGLLIETPYDAERDIAFYAEPKASSSLLLGEGDLALFYPEDAHKPGCMAGGRDAVRKVVVKVLLE